jgi:predicted ATP-grasp superfamily ATP-dependent carboligase
MTAIVTCGETKQSLSATRALGRAHIPVAVGAKMRPNLSMWSRYASSTFLLEDASVNAHAFAQSLADEMRARYATCALISSDDALWALSRFRELLPIAARRLLPPHYSVVRSLDHEALHHFAKSLSISCADLIRVPEHASVGEVLALVKPLTFPLLLRPIIPWIEREDGTRRLNHRVVVRSQEHLLELLKGDLLQNGFLVSAYTTMRAISYFGVADKGRVLAEGFQERLNELEPYNEVATLAITINPIPSVRNNAQKLLDALRWQGPFKVEFIKDKHGGYRLISLIGRLWGSLELSMKAGINIPLICYRLAEGTITKDILTNAHPNVRMRWLMGDAAAKITNPKQVLANIKHWAGHFEPSMWRSLLGRRTIINYYDVFDLDDPMPFLFELQNKTWKRAFGDKNQ